MNKLTRFTVQGFQSINGRFSIDFEGITLLCGPNSAGKSSLIDALQQSRLALQDALTNSRAHFPWHFYDGLGGGQFRLEMAFDRFEHSDIILDDYISKFFAAGAHPALPEILQDWVGATLTLNQMRPGIGISINGTSALRLVEAHEIETIGRDAGRWWEVTSGLIQEGVAINSELRTMEVIERNPLFFDWGSADEILNFGVHAIFIEINEKLAHKIEAALELGATPDFLIRDDTSLLIGPVSEDGYLPVNGNEVEFYRVVSDLIKCAAALALDCDWPLVCPDDRRILNTRATFYGDDETDQSEGFDQVNHILLDYCKEYDPEVIKTPRRGRGTPPDFAHSFVNSALSKLDDGISKYRIVTEVITNSSEFVGSTKRVDPYYALDLKKRYRLWVQTAELDDHVIVRGFEDVGSGLSYVLPVFATLDVAKIALIQQPELHLHPAAQCELGDILIEALSKGTGCVVETHSEHLILRILRRIREATSTDREYTVSPENVSILYFEPRGDGTRVHRIRVSDDGDFLDPWPKGFFSERGRELFPEEFL